MKIPKDLDMSGLVAGAKFEFDAAGFAENMCPQPKLPSWEPYNGYGIQQIGDWVYVFDDADKHGGGSVIWGRKTIEAAKDTIDDFLTVFPEYIKPLKSLLKHGKKAGLPADVIAHLEQLVSTTQMLAALKKNKDTEKVDDLLLAFVPYTFRWQLKLRDNDTLGEDFLKEYWDVLGALTCNIENTYADSNEKLKSIFVAQSEAVRKEAEEEQAAMELLEKAAEEARLLATRCSVCGQQGRYHIKPTLEPVPFSHHVIDLENGDFVTDIGRTVNLPEYFSCESCMDHFKANNPNYDGIRFWHTAEWWRRRNLICDAGIEYHL